MQVLCASCIPVVLTGSLMSFFSIISLFLFDCFLFFFSSAYYTLLSLQSYIRFTCRIQNYKNIPLLFRSPHEFPVSLITSKI